MMKLALFLLLILGAAAQDDGFEYYEESYEEAYEQPPEGVHAHLVASVVQELQSTVPSDVGAQAILFTLQQTGQIAIHGSLDSYSYPYTEYFQLLDVMDLETVLQVRATWPFLAPSSLAFMDVPLRH